MGYILNGTILKDIFLNGTETKKRYIHGTRYYSAGNIVTYYVDSNTYYQEEVDSDASCLNPTTFTPSKSGWAFVGWREDTIASGDVLSSKIMGDEPITLYAVFRQTVTVSYYQVSNSAKQQSVGNKYYNNGNYLDPTFTIYPNGYGAEWTFRGWTTGTAANDSVTYADIVNREFTSDVTLYVLLQRPVTLSYDGNGASSGSVGSETKYVYLNSYGSNTIINPTFTLKSNGYNRSDYAFTGWNLGAVGATVTLSSNTTAYAQWVQAVTNYGYTGGVQSFTAPASGTYQLEVWGAQGGTYPYGGKEGGKGGYAKGNVYLSAGTVLYIGVGGAGTFTPYDETDEGEMIQSSAAGGYNGGGAAYNAYCLCGSGGGATHIAKNTNRGVLANYASYTSEILIVAGGGGGGGSNSSEGGPGGSGGGTNGGTGTNTVASQYNGPGGTQTSGGRNNEWLSGTFGQGASVRNAIWGAGGGGGWYGGGCGGYYSGAGGGSGYTGGVSNGSMSNGAQSGNGYARVTFVAA